MKNPTLFKLVLSSRVLFYFENLGARVHVLRQAIVRKARSCTMILARECSVRLDKLTVPHGEACIAFLCLLSQWHFLHTELLLVDLGHKFLVIFCSVEALAF